MSIEDLKVTLKELEMKHREVKGELKESEKKLYNARKALFRAQYERAFNSGHEGIILEFMEYIINDFKNTLYLWHPIRGMTEKLYGMCEEMGAAANSYELSKAANRVLKVIEGRREEFHPTTHVEDDALDRE